MRIIFLFVFTVFISSMAYSQSLSVNEFKPIEKGNSDIIETRTDLNNRPCALIKVEFPVEGVKFQGNVIGDVAFKDNAYFVFLSPGSSYLQVKSPNASSFRIDFREFGLKRVEEGAIYCLILSNVDDMTADELYQRAIEYDNNGDSNGCLKHLHKAVDKGSIDAKGMLGSLYLVGVGSLNKDFSKAWSLLQESSQGGNDEATFLLGYCHMMGYGTPKNTEKALTIWKSLAQNGHVKSQANLGACYRDGNIVVKDEIEACKWFELAANQDDLDSQIALAVIYGGRNSNSKIKDDKKAFYWMSKAADSDMPEGLYGLAVCYEEGKGISKDINKAKTYYQRAADKGFLLAKQALIRLNN